MWFEKIVVMNDKKKYGDKVENNDLRKLGRLFEVKKSITWVKLIKIFLIWPKKNIASGLIIWCLVIDHFRIFNKSTILS